MRHLKDLHDGDRVSDIYLCKYRQSAVTKTGKAYENVILQDKTGTMDAKIWEPNSAGIEEFDSLQYVEVGGEVTTYNGAFQINIKRVRRVDPDTVNEEDFFPVSKRNNDKMYARVLELVASVKNPYLNKLLNLLFVEDRALVTAFRKSSAAKSMHHGFVGGLMEHTISVAGMCEYYARTYPILNHDLLITAALCHDIGKTRELSLFPMNDYTDEGQFLGHMLIGCEILAGKMSMIEGFPLVLKQELQHCILAHHGEYEYGSPKKPAIVEALALFFADNTDAKLEMFKEAVENAPAGTEGWLGFNRIFESNIRTTRE